MIYQAETGPLRAVHSISATPDAALFDADVETTSGRFVYAYRVGSNDNAPIHSALEKLHASGAFDGKISAYVRDFDREVDECLRLVDAVAARRASNPLAAIHAKKAEQAEQAIADGSATAELFPLLAASMTAEDNGELMQAAHRVRAAYIADMERIASIETVRMATKSAIRSAKDISDLDQVRALSDWLRDDH